MLLQFPPPLTPYLTAVRLTGLRPVLVELPGGVKVMLHELEVPPSYVTVPTLLLTSAQTPPSDGLAVGLLLGPVTPKKSTLAYHGHPRSRRSG